MAGKMELNFKGWNGVAGKTYKGWAWLVKSTILAGNVVAFLDRLLGLGAASAARFD